MPLGLIKWFDNSKGFGVLQNSELGEVFVHKNNFIVELGIISPFQAISFESENDKRGRKTARKCRLVGEPDDWKIIISSFNEPDNVSMEVEVRGESRHGNPFTRKKIQTFSVRKYAAKQLIEAKNNDEIFIMLTQYIDNGLSQELLFRYYKFIEEVALFVGEISRVDRLWKRNCDFDEVFVYLRNIVKPETLFRIWRSKHLGDLGYWEDDASDEGEYEIPEYILSMFSNELNIEELLRIKKFSFGVEFCQDFVNNKFLGLEQLSLQEIHKYYEYLDLLTEEKKNNIQV